MMQVTGRSAAARRPAIISALLAAALGATGCEVGPQYQGPPAQKLAELHNIAIVDSRQTGTPAPQIQTWWMGFNDPELTHILDRALAQNLDIAAAMARVEQARAAARAAGAQLLPTLDASGSATPLRQSVNSPVGAIARHLPGYERNQTLYDADVGAQWELDLSGGLRRAAEAARDEEQAAEAQQLGTRVSVVAEAADAYFQVRGDQARLAIADSQVQTDARLLELIRLRISRGAAAEKEVAQARKRSLPRRARRSRRCAPTSRASSI